MTALSANSCYSDKRVFRFSKNCACFILRSEFYLAANRAQFYSYGPVFHGLEKPEKSTNLKDMLTCR